MMVLFDKQIQLRMGQANVQALDRRPLAAGRRADVLGVEDFASHHLPLGGRRARLRDLPEEAGRRGQGDLPARDLIGRRSHRSLTARRRAI